MARPDAVVFLHAFPLHAGMWTPTVAALGDARPTLAPDLPGFGSRPPDGKTLEDFARVVLDEMDQAGFERVVVVGLSMGGYVAFRLFEQAPERVGALVLADTRASQDDDAGRARRTEQAERARDEGVSWMPEVMLPKLLGPTTRAEQPAVVRKVREMIGATDPEGVARALVAMRDRPDSRALLERIQVPALVLAGEEDELTGPDIAEEMATALPRGRLAVIPRAGHLSNLENPLAFDEHLARFLAEVD